MDERERDRPSSDAKDVQAHTIDTPNSSADKKSIGVNTVPSYQDIVSINDYMSPSSAKNALGDEGYLSDEQGIFPNFDGVYLANNFNEDAYPLKLEPLTRIGNQSDSLGQPSVEPPERPQSKHMASASQQVRDDWADLMATRVVESEEDTDSSAGSTFSPITVTPPITVTLNDVNGEQLDYNFANEDFISKPEPIWNKEILTSLPNMSRLSPDWETRVQSEDREGVDEGRLEVDDREDEFSTEKFTLPPDHPEESPERRKRRLEHRHNSEDLGVNDVNGEGIVLAVGKPPLGLDSDLAQLENLHLRDSTGAEGVQRLKEFEDFIEASIQEIRGQMLEITGKFHGIPLLYSLDDEIERTSRIINKAIKLRDNELARNREFGMNFAKTKLLKDIDGDRRGFFNNAPGIAIDSVAKMKMVTTPPLQKMTPTPPPSLHFRGVKILQIGSVVYKEKITVLEREIGSWEARVKRRNKEIEKLIKDYNEIIQENDTLLTRHMKATKQAQRLKEYEAEAAKNVQLERERADALNDELEVAKQRIEELHRGLAPVEARKELVDADLQALHSPGDRSEKSQLEQTEQFQSETEPKRSQPEATEFEQLTSTDPQPKLAEPNKFNSTYQIEIDSLTAITKDLEKKLENAEWELSEREKYYNEQFEVKLREINASNGDERRHHRLERREFEEKKQEYRSKLRKAQNELTAANATIQAMREQMDAAESATPVPVKPEKEEITVSLDESSYFDDSENPSSPFPARLQRALETEKDRWNMELHLTSLDSHIGEQEKALVAQKAQGKKDALTIRLQAHQIRALRGDIEYMETGVRNDAEGQLALPSTFASASRTGGHERDPKKRREKYDKLRVERVFQLWTRCETCVAKHNEQAGKLKNLGLKDVEEIGESYVADKFRKRKLIRPEKLHWKEDGGNAF
jgi:hypothetical protein